MIFFEISQMSFFNCISENGRRYQNVFCTNVHFIKIGLQTLKSVFPWIAWKYEKQTK